MNKKKQSKFKGYFLTVVCGLVVIAGLLFLILQYRSGLTAEVSIYGSFTDPPVSTMWVIVIAALAGPVFLVCCWWLARGIWILYTIRRAEAHEQKTAARIVSQAKKELAAAAEGGDEAPEAEGEPAGEDAESERPGEGAAKGAESPDDAERDEQP